jgi:hypothetical protein
VCQSHEQAFIYLCPLIYAGLSCSHTAVSSAAKISLGTITLIVRIHAAAYALP